MKNIKFNPFKYLFLIFLCLTLTYCSGGLKAGLEAALRPPLQALSVRNKKIKNKYLKGLNFIFFILFEITN